MLAGAVVGFGAVGAYAFEGINRVLAPGDRAEVRVWGGMHLPSAGSGIALVTIITSSVHGYFVWPVVGFTATTTYLLVIGVQFWFATRRGWHMAESIDLDGDAPPPRASPTSLDTSCDHVAAIGVAERRRVRSHKRRSPMAGRGDDVA